MSGKGFGFFQTNVCAVLDQRRHVRRIRHGSFHQHEVLGLDAVDDVVVENEETVLSPDHGVLGPVLDALATWDDDAEVAFRVRRFQHPAFAGHLGTDPDHQVLLTAGGPHRNPVPFVGLVEHRNILTLRRSQLVTPHRVRTPGVVDRHVEDVTVVDRPGGARRGIGNLVGEHLTGLEVLEPQGVPLVADDVHRVREQRAVLADGERAERKELVPFGFDVAVHEDLLVGQLDAGRQVGRSPVVFTGDGAPALDGVRLAFHAARVVPPLTHASGHRHVGFLRPRLDLLEDLLAQRLERGRLLVGVRVFGFEVCDYLGVVLVPQPLVVIDERVSVMGTFGGDLLCDRRDQAHALGPTQSSKDRPEMRSYASM